MSAKREPISLRTTRLNNLIVGNRKGASNRILADAISREGLLDAFCLLYNECDKDALRKREKNISEFVTKYRSVIEETKALRVNPDDFVVKTLIGTGYFGNVHLVKEKTSGDVYAMKKIKKSVVTTSHVKEERDIMSFRSSEWIVSLQYAFQDVDYLYLVMEFLPGGDLLSLMSRNGPFDEDLARFYLAELTLAIHALHMLGYVHRDIKPENILIDRFGHIKLADFGNSAALNKDGHVLSMSPVGTPDYIAPELLQTISTYKLSKSLHDVSCDYWSMGIIGYELICEVTPFHEENVHETYSKILSHCEDSHTKEIITFPSDLKVSTNFKNLILSLVTNPTDRLEYSQIIKHPYFETIKWESLRQQVPPIIPNVNGEEDTSNFEDVQRNKIRQGTYSKRSITTNIKSNEFTGKDLPFVGYSFVHMERVDTTECPGPTDDVRITKLNAKLKDLQTKIKDQTEELSNLKQGVVKAEQLAKHSDSQSRILLDTKEELTKMKGHLKEKTIELASCKTQMKTLQSSLKIEEEMWQKKEATITSLLREKGQKYEEAKLALEQRYEKQIAEKNNELLGILQKMDAREECITEKTQECRQLQEKLENYKKMLDSIKKQSHTDRLEFEKNKKQLTDKYEKEIAALRNQLQLEKDTKGRLTLELQGVRTDLEENISKSLSCQEAKERNIEDIKSRLSREIATNNSLRSENAHLENLQAKNEKEIELLKQAKERLQREVEIAECSRKLTQATAECISPYETAPGSLTDLHIIEEQLRTELQTAKENEEVQRHRADKLQMAVEKLEEIVDKFNDQPKYIDNMLEKQNEKLEELVTSREQIVLERQLARTANLSLWKVEKELEDALHSKKMIQRRMELTEEKVKKINEEKEDAVRKLKDSEGEVKQREARIEELKEELTSLKREVQKEHKMWEKAEQERMKEKSEVLQQISTVHRLEETISELQQKIMQTQKKHDTLNSENKRLLCELNEERTRSNSSSEVKTALEVELRNLEDNYERLKYVCTITDNQLTEIEAMLKAEQTRNQANLEKIEALHKSILTKDETITQLRRELSEENSNKLVAEGGIKHLTAEIDDQRSHLETIQKKLQTQHTQLRDQTNLLFETQEKLEVLTIDSQNMQTINENLKREIIILKEENARILTDLFRAKEEGYTLQSQLKDAQANVADLRQEIEELHATMEEKHNCYLQRDIKSEATLSQQKKLIDYLQLKVEDLSQKKKKTLADILFGTSTTPCRKENISPNQMESSIVYRALQEELKREKLKNKALQEQICKFTSSSPCSKSVAINYDRTHNIQQAAQESNLKHTKSGKKTICRTHRLELSILESDASVTQCLVCKCTIASGSSFWRCKECESACHRRCRNSIESPSDEISPAEEGEKDTMPENTTTSKKYSYEPTAPEPSESDASSTYGGQVIISANRRTPPLEVNCAFEIMDNILLLGCSDGLFTFNMTTDSLVQILGIDSVTCIATATLLARAILVGSNGEYLYQCDLRHLQTRSQSNAVLKPVLEASVLDLPFGNRNAKEKWQMVKISSEAENPADSIAIATTSSRIVVLKYDLKMQKFKPVHALDIANSVSSILFTRYTAIVGADKFFEIDLEKYTADEFVDLSDPTLSHTQTCQPMVAIAISSQEFLLCFMECGVFIDEYGCRSRPSDLNWQYTPTGFLYQAPFLYVSHFQSVQIIRLHRSYSNEAERDTEDCDEPSYKRTHLAMYMPTLLADSGKYNTFSIAIDKQTGIQEVYHIDALKAFESHFSISSDTVSSLGTCVTLGSMGTNLESSDW